jgi:hypothetical protein
LVQGRTIVQIRARRAGAPALGVLCCAIDAHTGDLNDGRGLPALTRKADPGRCPACRERVTPFAAGCAVCGADLDPARWDRGPGLAQRAGALTASLRFGPTAGRPRTSSSSRADTCFSCVLIGLVVSAAAAVVAAVLTLAGSI